MDLKGKRVAVLGLAFKELTDDVRMSRAFPLAKLLREAGATVIGHDPQGAENFRKADPIEVAATWQDAVRGADAVVFQVEWPEYKSIDPAQLKALLKSPIAIDGRRTLDAGKAKAAGLRYRAIGLGKA